MSADPLTDGEWWAQRELEALRAASFTGPALGRFLLAAGRRAAETRRQRPRLALQVRRRLIAGAGLWALLALRRGSAQRRRLAEATAWWLLVALMLDWHIGMFETQAGEPRLLGPADALTLTRAWLVPLVADGGKPVAIALAGATDVLDGIAARATAPTRAGRDLEGLVDSALIGAALLGARRRDELPRGVLALEAARVGGGFALTVLVWLGRAAPPRALVGAARTSTPLRFAGLVAGAAGRRRVGEAILGAGSLIGLAALGRAARRRS